MSIIPAARTPTFQLREEAPPSFLRLSGTGREIVLYLPKDYNSSNAGISFKILVCVLSTV
jgi:hypothetical protein